MNDRERETISCLLFINVYCLVGTMLILLLVKFG